MDHNTRSKLVRRMADAAIKCLSDNEWDQLEAWADDNLTCGVRFALEDAIALVVAFDR